MITIREYIDSESHSLYARWFNQLNAPAAAKVVTALVRMEQGNFSTTRGLDEGILECRTYFDREGRALVILLGGGTKKRQQKDIEAAKKLWKEYKRRKRQEH